MKKVLYLIINIFFIPLVSYSQVLQFFPNDRLCGTPQLHLSKDELQKITLNKEKTPYYLSKIFKVGESASFYIYNFETKTHESVIATLRRTELNINIWVEDTEWENNHVTDAVIQVIIDGLLYETPQGSINPDEGILEIIHSSFGEPPNSDGDGITDFLIHDVRDGWSDEGEGFVAGYFNELDQTDKAPESKSNGRDLLYIDSYPGIFYNDSYSYNAVLGTVAHEYQHLIHFNYDMDESDFVNEGLSELSSFLCGYGLRNPSMYLLNTNLNLTSWSSERSETLSHYAKVALWTYYIYEKYGLDLIREITKSSSPGIQGITAALNEIGESNSFIDIMKNFFTAITLNNPVLDEKYFFNLNQLQGLKARPIKSIYEYETPAKNITTNQNGYSLNLYSIENGDSLNIDFLNVPSNFELFINKRSTDTSLFLIPVAGYNYSDNEFGSLWNTEELMVINKSNVRSNFSFYAQSHEKSYVDTIFYTTGESDYNIQSLGNTNAVQYFSPYNNCKLKAISIYNHSSSGEVKVHVYTERLTNSNPSSVEKVFPNIFQGNWISLNLEDLEISRDSLDTFDIGIEYIDEGAMGYSKNHSKQGISYLNLNTEEKFSELSNYKVNDNEYLTGGWMMNMVFSAPLHNKPPYSPSGDLFSVNSIWPVPFVPVNGKLLKFIYTLKKSGKMKIDLFNILGQKVKNIFNGRETELIGMKYWNGLDSFSRPVSSGTYFLRFQFEDQIEVRRIIVIK